MKALVVFSNQMEDIEALGTRALLVRALFEVDTVSLGNKELITAYGLNVQTDKLIQDIDIDSYDILIVPGGRYVAHTIGNYIQLDQLIQAFHQKDKWIGAICAAPRFLGRLGLLDNKRFTAYPGSEIDIPRGIYLASEKTAVDGKIITARSVSAVFEFVYEIIVQLEGSAKAEAFYQQIIYQ